MVKEDSYILSWKKPIDYRQFMMHIICSNKSQKFYSHIYVDCPFIVDAVSCEAVRGMGLKVHRYSSNNLIC